MNASRAPLVVVLGSVNVDYVVTLPRLPGAGETVVGGRLAVHQGGKGANQAVAASRLGARTAMVGAVGDDAAGSTALEVLRAEGVDVTAVRLAPEPTGTALILVGPDGQNIIGLAPGANLHARAQDVTPLLSASAGVFVTCFEVPVVEAVAAAMAAVARGWQAIVNPAPAPGGLLDRRLATSGVIVVPNESELLDVTGVADEHEAVAGLRAWTGGPVIATLGERGALLCDDEGMLELAAPVVQARDTTGAGDAFIGALATALAQGQPLRDAVRYGITVASDAVTRPGARTVARVGAAAAPTTGEADRRA